MGRRIGWGELVAPGLSEDGWTAELAEKTVALMLAKARSDASEGTKAEDQPEYKKK